MGDGGNDGKSEGVATVSSLPRMAHELNNAANQLLLSRGLLEDVCRDLGPVLKQYARENGDFVLGGLSSADVGTELPQLLEGMRGSMERVKRVADELRRIAQGAASVPVESGGQKSEAGG
jgi:hypothetical protein